jgi:hypothetical protein
VTVFIAAEKDGRNRKGRGRIIRGEEERRGIV